MRYKKIKLSLVLMAGLFVTVVQSQTVKDIDGNVYKTITIGTQTWMAENLKTTKFNDGTEIPLATISGNEWADHTVAALTSPLYCWLYDSAVIYKNRYGAFYNGYSINAGDLCPTGWHIPSDTEWTILTTYLGGENVAGGKLKEEGTTHWNSPNNGATNETGFTARGGGSISDNGSNWDIGYNGYWWSSTINDETYLWTRLINNNVPNIYRRYADKHIGYPVRCIKD